MAKKLPHLYQKLYDLMREKDGNYIGRKTLHREVAICYRVSSADIDTALKELRTRKLVMGHRRGTRIL